MTDSISGTGEVQGEPGISFSARNRRVLKHLREHIEKTHRAAGSDSSWPSLGPCDARKNIKNKEL